MKHFIISGSPQKNSNTLRVARAINRLATESESLGVIDFNAYDLPFLNQKELTPDNLSDFQKTLVDNWAAADLLIVVTPEYNWYPSAELMNMLNQLGGRPFKHLFDNKVFAFVGVSSGRGGRIPTTHLNIMFGKLFNVLNTHSIASSKSFESQFTSKVLDAEGNSLGNAEYDKGLEAFVQYSLAMAQRWKL